MERMLYKNQDEFELDVSALVRMAVWCGVSTVEEISRMVSDALSPEASAAPDSTAV